jgi:2-hydroxychromene-2-carboxylate isomerase
MIRSIVTRTAARIITSPNLRTIGRQRRAVLRRLSGMRPTVHYFHQADDPYSQLCLAALPILQARYDIDLKTHAVSAPAPDAAPELEMLKAYATRDAAILVKGLNWPPPSAITSAPPPNDSSSLETGDRLRRAMGHYLSAMFYFEGEWYWGLDRLAFLEERLAPFRATDAPKTFIAPRLEVQCNGRPKDDGPARFEAFVSFRSPYTYLAMPRAIELAAHYGAQLELRFVLPMVMRGLPVPFAKQAYILRDCKREAERLGLPFGDVADPVGRGAERGLAVLNHAIKAGQGEAFAMSFLRGVFAEGISAASDKGLLTMAIRAGISATALEVALADESWRATAEANRKELFAAGVWGVPAFRVNGGDMLWGQDRLWAIEQKLQA